MEELNSSVVTPTSFHKSPPRTKKKRRTPLSGVVRGARQPVEISRNLSSCIAYSLRLRRKVAMRSSGLMPFEHRECCAARYLLLCAAQALYSTSRRARPESGSTLCGEARAKLSLVVASSGSTLEELLEVCEPCKDIVERRRLSEEHNLHALVVLAQEVNPIGGRKELKFGSGVTEEQDSSNVSGTARS